MINQSMHHTITISLTPVPVVVDEPAQQVEATLRLVRCDLVPRAIHQHEPQVSVSLGPSTHLIVHSPHLLLGALPGVDARPPQRI